MQTTNTIFLVKPANLVFNAETAASNAFQFAMNESKEVIMQKAFQEFDAFVETLRAKGINVIVFEDTKYPIKPDAIFPNNWATFHSNGTVILYPMFAPNRRHERRQDIIDTIKSNFSVNNILDLSEYEKENKFLEGTGSIVFDHESKIAYACLSLRTNKDLFEKVCNFLQYKPVYFNSYDESGKEIYHTNVMMCIGEKFAVICLESIIDKKEKASVSQSLIETGHQIVDITYEQMNNFAGNMLALHTNDNKSILVLSRSSFDSLTTAQKNQLEKYCELVPLPIKTIETIGGGSVRCMIAEVFLKPQTVE